MRLKDFISQNLANTMWTCATGGHTSPVLFDTYKNMYVFTHVSSHASPASFDATAKVAEINSQDFNSQELANYIKHTYVHKYHHGRNHEQNDDDDDDDVCLDAEEARMRLKDFTFQHANTKWTFATCEHTLDIFHGRPYITCIVYTPHRPAPAIYTSSHFEPFQPFQ
eukprot:4825803-Karenia_brevis.AAC.1